MPGNVSTSVRKRSLPASSGGLNLAHKTCRWSEAAPCFASGCEQTHLWFLSLDLWEIRLYSQKLKKAGKKRESLTSWASKVPHLLSAAIWILAGVWPFSLQLLPPFFSTSGLLISIARSAPKSQRNYYVNQNPGWNFQKDFTSDVVLQLLEPVWDFSSWVVLFLPS